MTPLLNTLAVDAVDAARIGTERMWMGPVNTLNKAREAPKKAKRRNGKKKGVKNGGRNGEGRRGWES